MGNTRAEAFAIAQRSESMLDDDRSHLLDVSR